MTNGLFALGGKLRAGKDVVGDYLEEHYGYVKMGMSDPLNDALLKLDPYIPMEGDPVEGVRVTGIRYRNLHDAVGYVEAKKIPEVRRLLQVLGTEVGRNMLGNDVWIKPAEKKIRALWDEGKDVVITAVRFPNEIEMVERLGGATVWISRPDELRGADTAVANHSSETAVSKKDFEWSIDNDSSLEALHERIERLLRYLKGTQVRF